MFGGNDEDDSSEAEEANADETWNSMVESVEEAAAPRIEKAREPFRFDVFRNSDGEVTQWALMADRRVDGEESRVPVVVGQENNREVEEAMWFEYDSRFHQDRDETVFEYVQREQVVPSNTFYAWISDAVERLAEFHEELDRLENEDAFHDLNPNLPPLYDSLNQYEAHALRFFGDTLLEHRSYTEDQANLIFEAVRRYPIDEEVGTASLANSSKTTKTKKNPNHDRR